MVKIGHYAARRGDLHFMSYPHIDTDVTLTIALASPKGNRSASRSFAIGGALLLGLVMMSAIDNDNNKDIEATHSMKMIHLTTSQKPLNVQALYHSYAYSKIGRDRSGMECLITLWNRESNWRTTARNGAYYGIPQLPIKRMYGLNPLDQIDAGISYIGARYGSICKALTHSYRKGWY